MNRRRCLQTMGAIGAGRLLGSPHKLWAAQPSSTEFLNQLREKVHDWTESLWDAKVGGFHQNETVGANLLSTTDVAWLRYATNDTKLEGKHRDQWIRFLQRGQDPKTGVISYGLGAQGHKNGHAMWHTVRALNIVCGKLLHFPHHLREVTTVEGLREWFDAVDWDSRKAHHHEVLGLVPLLSSLDDGGWTEMFYRKIGEQQNPKNGAWSRSRVNISRTFAYTALHRATGRMPAHPEKIVDTILSLQNKDGYWGSQPTFSTMDAAYILVRLPKVIEHRQNDARPALNRLASKLEEFFPQNEERIMQNPHWMLAIVHTFGLLQEAFPDRFPSQRPFRFDWDKPSMYHCDVIAREGKN